MLVAFKDNADTLLGSDASKMVPFSTSYDIGWRASNLITSFMDPNISDKEYYINGFDDRMVTEPQTKEAVKLLNKWYTFVLMLDRVTDVRNFGAIARTAYAAGVDAIVIPSKGSALINGDAMKTSAGALSLINVCRVDNMKDAIDFLQASGLRVVGFTEKAKESLWKSDLTGPLCVMMGSEEDGISPAYLKRLDAHLMIPMPGDIDSLNVSVATGIVCFEVVRQRQ